MMGPVPPSPAPRRTATPLDPRLVGHFPADGSDGSRHLVSVWLAFGAGGAPDARPALTLGDGRPVACAGDGRLLVTGSDVALTADVPADAATLAAFHSAYGSVAPGPDEPG